MRKLPSRLLINLNTPSLPSLLTAVHRGDFYDPGHKNVVVPPSAVNHLIARPHEVVDIAASGVDGASEGGYDLYDGDTKICHVGWNVPRVETADSFGISHTNDNYMVRYKGAHLEHGPIGDVDIIVKEIH